MSTSGKTPPADNRNLASRVAPRRHQHASSQPATTNYDSSEFPVLLRMPDVSRPVLRIEPNPTSQTAHLQANEAHSFENETVNEAVRPETSTRQSRRSWRDGGSAKSSSFSAREKRMTGSAMARFWSTVPPQVASGGMLLAVIGMCFVLLRGTHSPQPPATPQTEWTEGGSQKTSDDVADVPITPVPLAPTPKTTEWHPERSSVATKPSIAIPEPTPAKRAPQENSEPSRDSWPTLPPASPGDGAPPAQGWPDDMTNSSEDQGGTMLNAPVESAQWQRSPGIRMSQREVRPQTPNSATQPRMTDAPYPNGSFEIPPPTQIYRK